MKLLIVDDSPGVVMGLREGLDWVAAGISDVVTAGNAMEAKESIKNGDIDIMLCDIEMPFENGLTLYRWIKQEGFGISCIFLTSHAEFQYAQEAVKLGAFDYIVQPAPYDEVMRVVARAILEVKSKKEKDHVYDMGVAFREEEFTISTGIQRDYLLGAVSLSEAKRLGGFSLGGFIEMKAYLACIQITRWNRIDGSWKGSLLALAMTNIINELAYDAFHLSAVAYVEENLFCLILKDKNDELLGRGRTEKLLSEFSLTCSQILRCSLAVFVSQCTVLENMPHEWKCLSKLKTDNVALRSGVFFGNGDMNRGSSYKASRMQHLGNLIRDGYPDAMASAASDMLDELVMENRMNMATLGTIYQDFMHMLYLNVKGGRDAINDMFSGEEAMEIYRDGMKSVDSMKTLIHHVASNMVRDEGQIDQKAIVQKIKAYIGNNLDKELRRDDIVNQVHLNADYLTRIFKKETGSTVKEYITSEKMKEAKRLLRTTQLPVSFIAAKLGYCNFSHFSYTYRKVMGYTPQEERHEQED